MFYKAQWFKIPKNAQVLQHLCLKRNPFQIVLYDHCSLLNIQYVYDYKVLNYIAYI